MTDNGARSLELVISEVNLDKTIMEKSILVNIDIGNRHISTAPINKMIRELR